MVVFKELLLVNVSGSEIIQVELVGVRIVCEVGWIWVALHDAHFKHLLEC